MHEVSAPEIYVIFGERLAAPHLVVSAYPLTSKGLELLLHILAFSRSFWLSLLVSLSRATGETLHLLGRLLGGIVVSDVVVLLPVVSAMLNTTAGMGVGSWRVLACDEHPVVRVEIT